MRYCILLILLVFQIAIAQDQPLEVVIDQIVEDNSDANARKFTVNFHLANLTDMDICFFLKPDDLVSNNDGSMSNHPYYKIYQNDNFLNLGTVFGRQKKGDIRENITIDPKNISPEVLEYLKTYYDITDEQIAELKEFGYFKTRLKVRREELMNHVITLKPKESRAFSKVISWDKDRYFFHDPEEFYLSETEKHYLEITVLLMKETFKEKLSEEDYTQIMANPNFLKGVFVSNKAEINFN